MDWKSLVKSIAPVLGTALGGPMGGMATKFLAEKFLGKPDASEEDVAAAVLGASPEKLLEVKKMDQEFKLSMARLGVDVFKLEVEDKASARDLAKLNMVPHIALSGLYSVGYFGLLYLLVSGNITVPADVKDTFTVLVGVLTAAQVKIMDFWFGSSYGSKVKDAAK